MEENTNYNGTVTKNVSCPFCGILCDDLVIQNEENHLKVLKNGCLKSKAIIQKDIAKASAQLKGKNVSLDEAIDHASNILKKSHAPLFAGLGTEVSGMRKVMELADKTGAILDHMHGDGLIRNILVLQDLGWLTTTMAEIKNRADLVIFAGTDATNFPRFYERVIWNKNSMFIKNSEEKDIVYIGDNLDSKPGISPNGKRPIHLKCKTEEIGEIISSLHALASEATLDVKEVAGIKISTLKALAEKMKTTKYGVIVWAPSELDIPHAELTIQNFCETVKYLTRFTRFAGFSLGGNDGGMSAIGVSAWQSGYPLRVNFNKGYPDYDAHRYSTKNVLKNKEVDALLWVSSFESEKTPPKASIPTIVLGNPGYKLGFKPDVFIPVATPGVDHTGQIIRTDNVVSLPLKQLRHSPYESVHSILKQIIVRL